MSNTIFAIGVAFLCEALGVSGKSLIWFITFSAFTDVISYGITIWRKENE